MGRMAIDISFTGLSSAAIRLELSFPQRRQRCISAHSPFLRTHTPTASIIPPQSEALSPGSSSTCRLERQLGLPVGNQSAINVTLKEDTQTLDEVVVVGYGTMRKSDVTGSIGVAKGDDLTKNQNFSALDNLRGKVSGVNIFSNSSQPGAYSNRVVIRGMATINASSNPLYVVDGVVMENFDLVNPNDIESMEVLKDASAAAIYGARGANGVIMVTTKRGKKDGEGVQVSYQGSVLDS